MASASSTPGFKRTTTNTHVLLAQAAGKSLFPKLTKSLDLFLQVARCSQVALSARSSPLKNHVQVVGRRTVSRSQARLYDIHQPCNSMALRSGSLGQLGLFIEAKRKKINSGSPVRVWNTDLGPASVDVRKQKYANAMVQVHETSYVPSEVGSDGTSPCSNIKVKPVLQCEATPTSLPRRSEMPVFDVIAVTDAPPQLTITTRSRVNSKTDFGNVKKLKMMQGCGHKPVIATERETLLKSHQFMIEEKRPRLKSGNITKRKNSIVITANGVASVISYKRA